MPVTIDGVKSQIESQFAKVYEKLYNSVNDKGGIQEVKEYLSRNIDERSLDDVNLVTPSLVKKAINRSKNDKTDPVYAFNSNCSNRS